MKKFFFFAAAAFAAMSINAQTIDFPEIISTADFGATKTYSNGEVSLVINNGSSKFAVDANKAKFGTVEEFVQDTMRLKTGGASGSKSSMVLNVPAAGKVYVHARSASGTVARVLTFSQNGLDILNANLNDAAAVETTIEGEGGPETVKIFPVFSCNVKAGAIDLVYGQVGEGSTETDDSKIKAGGINIYSIMFQADGEEGIEELLVAPKANKVVYNGQVVIVKEGRMFNLLGAEIMK